MKSVVFVSGLGGTGKSSVMYYFLENPIKGFSFYDFDKGKYKSPPHEKSHHKWRTKQNNWWLIVAHKEFETKGNIAVILGLCLFPKQVQKLPNAKYFKKNDIKFGHLTAKHETRRDRLIERGSPHHWHGIKPWYKVYFKEMSGKNLFEIDTTHRTIKEVAQDLHNELLKINRSS